MKSSTWGKIFGWAQFAITTLAQVGSAAGGAPHGWRDWTALIASLAMAFAAHHASSTDGTN